MSADNRPVVFCTATNRLIDVLRVNETADAALARLAAYGTALTVLPIDDAMQRYEATFKSDPVEITEATWHEMLGVLPPVGWRNTGAEESFKISERTAGSVTAIYARIGERHFQMSDSIFMTHEEIIARVRDSAAFRESESSQERRTALIGSPQDPPPSGVNALE